MSTEDASSGRVQNKFFLPIIPPIYQGIRINPVFSQDAVDACGYKAREVRAT